MNPSPTTARKARWSHAGYCILALVLLVPVLGVVGVTGFFRLSSETTMLRESVMSAVPGHWNKTIALHVGWITTGLVRVGSRFFKLEPEPRAGLDALHGAEVGIYQLEAEPETLQPAALFARADKAMAARGWERVVGVSQERQIVAVYLPRRGLSLSNMRGCVMVLQGRELVVACARGNLEPLFQLASSKFNLPAELRSAGL